MVMVALPEVPARVMPVPPVIVTSVPVLLFSVRGEDVPEIVKSVADPPPPVDAIVTTPAPLVPVVVSVTPEPSTS